MSEHRIERGPVRHKSFASKELLAMLRSHYRQSMIDADGKPIVLGQEFTYLDWDGEYIYYVYRQDGASWMEIGQTATEEQAQKLVEG